MIAPYGPRLLCICLAAFFVIHFLVGLAVAVSGPAAVRAARRMRPRSAARFLLVLRLLPAVLAVFLVAGLCIPSYLWLEPDNNTEEIGTLCLISAMLAAAICTISIVRGVRATVRSTRLGRECQLLGRLSTLPGAQLPVWTLNSSAPFLALVGVFASRVAISRSVIHALSTSQLAAALRHENAHRVSRDNLKRLLLLLAPGLLPGLRGFDTIERGWARFSEWAADDEAVAGSDHLSLSLAAALVRIARMGGSLQPLPLSTSFLGDSREISARVDRLLNSTPAVAPAPRSGKSLIAVCAALAVGCAAILRPATLESAHRILERLIN
jgi:Zn-dependent protease with chaperone function